MLIGVDLTPEKLGEKILATIYGQDLNTALSAICGVVCSIICEVPIENRIMVAESFCDATFERILHAIEKSRTESPIITGIPIITELVKE